MDELLAIAQGLHQRSVEPGDVLLVDGQPVGALYVLLEGALRIEKAGVAIATVTEPGRASARCRCCSASPRPPMSSRANRRSWRLSRTPPRCSRPNPGSPLALARLLATRLQVMTTYLADLKQQYADHEGGLGMVDVVLGSLMRSPGARSRLGSERDPDPEY